MTMAERIISDDERVGLEYAARLPRPTAPDARQKSIDIAWTSDKLIGYFMIDGELWAEVEWSEKRQRWCIQDAQGRCLKHVEHIHAQEVDREAAAALAKAMIRDGRLPDPKTARQSFEAGEKQRQQEREKRRQQRAQQPAQIAKREREREQEKQRLERSETRWDAEAKERREPPLYEVLADAFDFSDPDLWKSNSFASLRPRLIIHVRHVIAKLEDELDYETRRSGSQPFRMYATAEQRKEAATDRKIETSAAIQRLQPKLDRAREILSLLEVGEK